MDKQAVLIFSRATVILSLYLSYFYLDKTRYCLKSMEDNPSDRDLALFMRIAKGDVSAFEEIFHASTAKLFPTVIKIVRSEAEAEEIIQEVFLRLWLKRKELPAIANPGAGLHTIAANLSLTSLRRQAREFRRTQLVAENMSAVPENLSDQLDIKILKGIVDEAIAKLPAARRKVFTMSRMQGMSRREIAEKLGVSESTVKNQLTAALRFIQDHLDRQTRILIPSCISCISILQHL
jgi:RNA polymerase sigma-70 factor (ECF subfamily)